MKQFIKCISAEGQLANTFKPSCVYFFRPFTPIENRGHPHSTPTRFMICDYDGKPVHQVYSDQERALFNISSENGAVKFNIYKPTLNYEEFCEVNQLTAFDGGAELGSTLDLYQNYYDTQASNIMRSQMATA